MKLVVTDFANPPLNLSSVQYSAAMRQLIFAAPESGKYREPLRLYFGNKLATPANYDFAQRLPATLTPPPQRVELGERVPNPNYQPPPAELAQQMPWLIYTMLGLTSLALLAILGVLARAAIRRHDAAGRATPVS